MKKILFYLLILSVSTAYGNDSTRLYNPFADAEKEIARALAKAKAEKKQVLLFIGGNWCVNCYRLNAFIKMDSALHALMTNNYVVYHLNYSKENKNLACLKKLGHPQRFGVPVLVILNEVGNRLHTQDMALLQKGNGYDKQKIEAFLNHWRVVSTEEVARQSNQPSLK